MKENNELSSVENSGAQDTEQIVSSWNELIATLDFDGQVKNELANIVEQIGQILGKPGNSSKFDELGERLNSLAYKAEMKFGESAKKFTAIINKIHVDASRKYREHMQQ